MAKKQKKSIGEGVTLTNQTAGNLKKYLERFPSDARVVIHDTDRGGSYHLYDCVIGCNFEYQENNKTVIFACGFVVEG